MKKIPTTVITGSLGAGKTTLVMNLVKQLPKDYNTIWLKNEYGDVNIDSELAKSSNIKTKEILNGCLCCVLVGKLHNALVEIVEKYNPDHLIIETAGTAYPFPIINEISRVEKLKLDGLITVIDALNYSQFKDKSFLARQQAQYVDLVVINKINLVKPVELEIVLDDVYDLFPRTPKIKTIDGFVSKELLIGHDAKLAKLESFEIAKKSIDKEDNHDHSNHKDEVETFSFFDEKNIFDKEKFNNLLVSLKNKNFYRIKGIINTGEQFEILNYVLGRVSWEKLENYKGETKINFMAKSINGILKNHLREGVLETVIG